MGPGTEGIDHRLSDSLDFRVDDRLEAGLQSSSSNTGSVGGNLKMCKNVSMFSEYVPLYRCAW